MLTWFPWRWGFNSRGLKWICADSSSADVRCSRGKFDQIRRNFVINPAPIGSQSRLNVGGSWRTQDLAKKLLNSFTIQSRVKKTREEHRFLKEILPKKRGLFNLKKLRWTSTIARTRWGMIPWCEPTFSFN